MSRVFAVVLMACACLALTTGPLAAQSVLERLENRLKAGRGQPVGEPAAAAAPAPTSETPGEAADELPPPLPRLGTPADDSAVERASLGIHVVDNTPAVRQCYGLTVLGGAVIQSVREGGPAAVYGLPIGGAIVAVDGRVINSTADLVRTLQAYQPGEEVELKYCEQDRMARKRVRLSRAADLSVVRVPARMPADGTALAEGAAPAPAAAPPAAAAPLPEPPLRLGNRFGDRPVLNRLGRVLDDVLTRGAAAPPAPVEAPPARPQPRAPLPAAGADAELPPVPRRTAPLAEQPPAGEVVELWKQVQSLQQQLVRLQQRVAELEKQLDHRATPDGKN